MTGDSDKRCSFLLLQNEFFYRTGEGQRIWLSVSTKNVFTGRKTIYIEETATG